LGATLNNLGGNLLGPILNTVRQPSEIFLANTGSGQKSTLFSNLNMNLYSPDYNSVKDGGGGSTIVNVASSIINPNGTSVGAYYVGSKTAEPGLISSPNNQIPVDFLNRQVQTNVYGNSELSQLYEGNINRLNFGLAGKSTSDGGPLDGGLVWVSPKYRGDAGRKATPGGGSGTIDNEFNIISNSYLSDESTNVTFKQGSILDETQRLINSADKVIGKNRLKHVGNAINQVSKVFNDGYKEMTKGSKVLVYKNNTDGSDAGIEYGRVFAKDTPYYTYADLQKTEGITKSGRRFSYSVLDNTYNLNIAPIKNPGSTNIVNGKVKKYMLSIENLAWRSSNRPGLTYDDLPECERGPNGGRIMWFPPYDLKFDDSSDASFTETTFLGRPEPIFTYNKTSRQGKLSFSIVVDHPSIINTIVQKQLAKQSDEKINSIVDSFFAGCVKYDLYELAKKFNQIPTNQLYYYQDQIKRMTSEEYAQLENSINKDNSVSNTNSSNNQNSVNPSSVNFSKYDNVGLYFDNNTSGNYSSDYSQYIAQKTTYGDKGPETVQVSELTYSRSNVPTFFDSAIIPQYNEVVNMINEVYNFLSNNQGTITINLASSSLYNRDSYMESVKNFILTYEVNGKTLESFTKNPKTLTILTNSEQSKTVSDNNGTFNCTKPITENGVENDSLNYTIPSMACRRVSFKVTNTPQPPKQEEQQKPQQPIAGQPTQSQKPTAQTPLIQKLKDGISKQIIRNLFNEGTYFEYIKENDPAIYTTFKQKIKYFDPAFHSTTPEGLNSRLTFLNQCVRPGDTIPVINTDGTAKFNSAVNTAFGTPPILVIRVGDFYNTKAVPKSLSISYENLDFNPEGIGVQPMIAKVSISFSIIGGMGLAKPVEELQNALSFSYYANTEIYDERATPTDDSYVKIDKEVVDAIVGQQASVSNQTQNNAGNTIGTIVSQSNIQNGITGTISYEQVMNSLLTLSNDYYTNSINQAITIGEKYNLAVLNIINQTRNYTKGTINGTDVELYGKPEGYEANINSLFDKILSEISDNSNPIISKLVSSKKYAQSTIDEVKTNLTNYVKNMRDSFSNDLSTIIQNIVTQEQSLITLTQKINFVTTKYDGKKLNTGVFEIYNLVDSTGTIDNLKTNYGKVATNLQSFIDYGKNEKSVNFYFANSKSWDNTNQLFTNVYTKGAAGAEFQIGSSNRFYVIMNQILKNKDSKNQFIDTVVTKGVEDLSLNINKDTGKIKNDFTDIVEKINDSYVAEYNEEMKLLKKVDNTTEFKDLKKNPYENSFKSESKKTFSFITNNGASQTVKTQLSDIYSSQNANTDKSTYNGKVKLN